MEDSFTGNSSVAVSFSKDGVDSASDDFGIARLDLLLGGSLRLHGVVWDSEALGLKFSNGSRQLGKSSRNLTTNKESPIILMVRLEV